MRIENSFVPVDGVGEQTERALWAGGVTCWGEFDRSSASAVGIGSRRANRIETFIENGHRRLEDGDLDYFFESMPSRCGWRCYENVREETCFLDIETTGLDRRRHEVTTVSLHCGGETTTLVAGRDLSTESLNSAIDDAAMLVTFNGRQFDVPFLETNLDLSLDLPHVDLRYPCSRIGLTGGLKAIERSVGIHRDRPDLSGRDAVDLWHRHCRGEQGALETLIEYNRADTVNLQTLMDLVSERLHHEVYGSVVGESLDHR